MLAHPNVMVIGMIDVAESEGTSLSHGHTDIGCHVLAANAPGVAVLNCREYGWCCNWLHAHAGWGTGEAVTGIIGGGSSAGTLGATGGDSTATSLCTYMQKF